LKDLQEKVLFLAHDAGRAKVLYDTLEMDAPSPDVPWAQRALDEELGRLRLKRAIVVQIAASLISLELHLVRETTASSTTIWWPPSHG